jgi:ketosteroid isomerase-like protein
MFAKTPEDVHRLFNQAFNAGDLDDLLTLSEPESRLVPQPGQPVTGPVALREALRGFLARQ